MSRREKLIESWKTQPTPTANVETVKAVLIYYFSESFSTAEGSSHQLRINHPALHGKPNFEGGTLSIPVKNGQFVKGVYLKRIAKAIEIVEAARKEENENEASK